MLSSLPFADELRDFFHDGLGRQTSACLYGSAATGNWVPNRSDLDLIVFVPKEQLDLLGQKVREWSWRSAPKHPILDGYAVSRSGGGLSTKRLDEFVRVTYPSDAPIDLVDQWMIKNRSKHLFGDDSVSDLFPDICQGQLSAWASAYLRNLSVTPDAISRESYVILSKLIWSISWSARMLMLSRGQVCESKQEALRWLANEHREIEDLVRSLLDDYSKSDEAPASITVEQSVVLRKFCLRLLVNAA